MSKGHAKHDSPKASIGERMREALHGHFREALEGRHSAASEYGDPDRELAEAEAERRTMMGETPKGYSSEAPYDSDKYLGGGRGAGAPAAFDLGIAAGAAGANLQGLYGASEGNSTALEPRNGGGRNNREFERREGVSGGDVRMESTEPAVDHTYAGPGTGVPSSGIQRLP
ncbi:hypothetical protein PsYK624_152720 [Phanerochaete sordida]|uniref:Uncharacterized protein n=1 Tax=Phanerochaete sordida TaxID=48140 RepID=A0A9P3GT35_9APHY|nr:hypothetical protein PsYK624_152720 [Phanerochaete sordida]